MQQPWHLPKYPSYPHVLGLISHFSDEVVETKTAPICHIQVSLLLAQWAFCPIFLLCHAHMDFIMYYHCASSETWSWRDRNNNALQIHVKISPQLLHYYLFRQSHSIQFKLPAETSWKENLEHCTMSREEQWSNSPSSIKTSFVCLESC